MSYLQDQLKNIADAIRYAEESSLPIKAADFASRIRALKAEDFDPSLVDAWFMSELKNEDKPATILGYKDHELTTSNFAWAGMSGVNGYNDNFKLWVKDGAGTVNTDIKVSTNNLTLEANQSFLYKLIAINAKVNLNVRIQGMRSEDILYFGNEEEYVYTFTKNGEYKITYTSATEVKVGFRTKVNTTGLNVTVEQIPLYEGALVFDGIDDYLQLAQTNFQIGTVISRYVSSKPTSYIFDTEITRTYLAYAQGGIISGVNELGIVQKDDIIISNYKPRIITSNFYIGCYYGKAVWGNPSIYFIAIYENVLTTEQADKEVIKLNNEWERRLKL